MDSATHTARLEASTARRNIWRLIVDGEHAGCLERLNYGHELQVFLSAPAAAQALVPLALVFASENDTAACGRKIAAWINA